MRYGQSMRCGVLIVGLISAALTVSASAADFEQNKKWCFNAADPDLRIGGCTWLIQSGRVSGKRGLAIVFNGRAIGYEGKGDWDRALADLTQAIEIDATYAGSYLRRGQFYQKRKDLQRAISDYDRHLFLSPESAVGYYRRGICHESLKRFRNAIADYGEAVRLKPDNSRVLNGKAWLLATAPDDVLRNGAEAVELATRAVALKETANYRDTLAAAYAEAGDFTAAVREQERAIARLKEQGNANLVADYQARLTLYEQGKPYRMEQGSSQ